MGKNVLIVAEQRGGVLKKVALELLGVGAKLAAGLGGQVEAALLGSGVGGLAGSLGQHGVAKVYLADDPALGTYSSEGYANTLAALIQQVQTPPISKVMARIGNMARSA